MNVTNTFNRALRVIASFVHANKCANISMKIAQSNVVIRSSCIRANALTRTRCTLHNLVNFDIIASCINSRSSMKRRNACAIIVHCLMSQIVDHCAMRPCRYCSPNDLLTIPIIACCISCAMCDDHISKRKRCVPHDKRNAPRTFFDAPHVARFVDANARRQFRLRLRVRHDRLRLS